MARSHVYMAAAAVLALGAPVGLLAARSIEQGRLPSPHAVIEDVARNPLTYAYVTLGTMGLLVALGWVLGRQYDRMRLLSVTDPLTGLFNRRQFGDRLTDEMRRGNRYGHAACVLSVDIDHLKAINDRFGHREGDAELVAVSGILSHMVRGTDIVARVGGDEFAVLLPQTSVQQASAISMRILTEVARTGRGTPSGFLGVSIGIAEMSSDELLEPYEVMAIADAALYRAKDAGGSRAAIAVRPVGPGGLEWTLLAAVVAAGPLSTGRPFDARANPEVGGES